VLKYIIKEKVATKLTKAPPVAFRLPKELALHNILCTVLVCKKKLKSWMPFFSLAIC